MDLPYSSNRLLVRLKLNSLIHVGLPVLDVAVVVAGHHPAVVVRPDHRADGDCVSLKLIMYPKLINRFKLYKVHNHHH